MKIKIILLITMIFTIFCGCSKNGSGNTSPPKEHTQSQINIEHSQLKNVYDKVAKTAWGNENPQLQELDGLAQMNKIFGLTDDMMEDFIAYVSQINNNVDTFVGIEVNGQNTSIVSDKLNNFKESLINDHSQNSDYINLAKAQASQVIVYDKYVFFICLGNIDESLSKEDMYSEASNQIEKIVKEIESIIIK